MKNKAFMILTIILACLLLLVFLQPQLMISPGQLIPAHKAIATDCFACHSALFGSQADKCIACHKVKEIGIRTRKGILIRKEKKSVAFHQRLLEEDCIACHSDHRGVKAFRPIRQFSHNLLEKTAQVQCDGCHSNPGDALHRKIKGNCSLCHNKKSWLPATFDHKKYFRFDRHHDTDCTTCHRNNNYESYTCYGCHEHSRSEVRHEHYEEGIYEYENCVKCHRSADEDEAERIWRKLRYQKGGRYKREQRRESERNEHREHDDD